MPSLSTFKFDSKIISDIKDEFENGTLKVDESYQRSDVWKESRKQALIKSIMENYPIGVLVLWENKKDQLDILDGQQRVKSIVQFLNDKFTTLGGKKFSELSKSQRKKIEAYDVHYLELLQKLTEEEISNIFIILQEGLPLNTPEKVFAFRGNFREMFVSTFFDLKGIFFGKLDEKKFKRFKDRFLAAQFLFLEIKTRFKKNDFPDLTYPDFKEISSEYKTKAIASRVATAYKHNIKFLGTFLHEMIGAIEIRDMISFYLLISYFRQFKVKELGQGLLFRYFAKKLLKDLYAFSINDQKPPKGMKPDVFQDLMDYKIFGRQATSSQSFEKRFEIIKKQYERLVGKIVLKDRKRFFSNQQKVTLYFQQESKCAKCKRELVFFKVQGHHKKKHADGGKTEIVNGKLLCDDCHKKIHNKKV